jgi:hypothetical protein
MIAISDKIYSIDKIGGTENPGVAGSIPALSIWYFAYPPAAGFSQEPDGLHLSRGTTGV